MSEITTKSDPISRKRGFSQQSGPDEAARNLEDTLGLDRQDSRKSRRRWFYVLLALAIIAAGLWIWWRLGAAAIPEYITQEVTRGELVQVVSATGDLTTVNTVEVVSEISGLIRSVYVEENDRVSAGQLLVSLDTDRLEAEVTQASAYLL